jgi:hypothetical protein
MPMRKRARTDVVLRAEASLDDLGALHCSPRSSTPRRSPPPRRNGTTTSASEATIKLR